MIPVERLEQLRELGGEREPAAPEPRAARRRTAPGCRTSPTSAASRPARGRSRSPPPEGTVLITGPPGAGKSMAARRLPSILPPLGPREAVEATRVASACGRPVEPALAGRRPVPRPAPHDLGRRAGRRRHPAAGRRGDARAPRRPLPRRAAGVRRGALEALRQPLEDGRVRISRARYAIELPCRFQLVAAANPCPCGRGRALGRVHLRPGRGARLRVEAHRRARRPHRPLGRRRAARPRLVHGARARARPRSASGCSPPASGSARRGRGRANAELDAGADRGSAPQMRAAARRARA